MTTGFFEDVATKQKELGHPLCLGIDPPVSDDGLSSLPFFQDAWQSDPLTFLGDFCNAALIGATQKVASVKFQSAFFEAHGPAGVAQLYASIKEARNLGFKVILDAKRGDISSTMRAYGCAAFDRMEADALTITPYMGEDVIAALVPWLKTGKAIYVVWRTSNPAAKIFQNASVNDNETVASLLKSQILKFAKQEGVMSSIGFVVGVDRFSEVANPEEAPLLMPGLGPQGGTIDAALRSFWNDSPSTVVPMSRGLTGLGDTKQNSALAEIDSWSGVSSHVSSRISLATSQLSC